MNEQPRMQLCWMHCTNRWELSLGELLHEALVHGLSNRRVEVADLCSGRAKSVRIVSIIMPKNSIGRVDTAL